MEHDATTDSLRLDSLGSDERLASLFRWFIGIALATLCAGIAIVLSFGDVRDALIIVATLPLVLLAELFVRKRRMEAAAVFLALVLGANITLVSTLGLGVHSVSIMAFPTILVLASLVTRRRAMIFLTLFVLACLAWLVFGELSGLFKPETLEKSVIGDFITVAVIIGVTAFLGSFVSADLFRGNRRLKEELEQRRRAEERLAADMAGRLEIEGKLREALDEKTALLGEKELLLKEVHHRVKNNMQVVASILSLQADLLEDPATVAILRESQNRVFSLSLVHEQLYKTSNLASINFREYLENLASTLADSYDSKAKHVQFAYRIGELALGVEQAIPCGLIVNELVSNALKHAFPDRGKGTVVIGLLELRDGRYELSVEDDGVGIALDKDWRVTTSLGMQLVQSLTKQLRGEVNLERLSPGSRFTIHFSPS